jgi:DMSO/TMAO reductase YedYZ molybdopterin-dependent catalytic subunit
MPSTANDESEDSPTTERPGLVRIDPPGTHIRHPPPPHELDSFITPDTNLFQTIHMGPAVVDLATWRLHITGLVDNPLVFTFSDLTGMTSDITSITAFHECYGPPTARPTKNYWRIGNVTWTGIPLSTLLRHAGLQDSARYIWSEGLDHGTFAGHYSHKYQKDLTLDKAMSGECMIAWKMNGQLLSKERGGPVRSVVPGWFGTNSTKWLWKIDVRAERAAETVFTTKWYNEADPGGDGTRMRPVWEVEVNSFITTPRADSVVGGQGVVIEGWAWSFAGVKEVVIGLQGGEGRMGEEVCDTAYLQERSPGNWHWQRFSWQGKLGAGKYKATSIATCKSGLTQPIEGRRNHVHAVSFKIQ